MHKKDKKVSVSKSSDTSFPSLVSGRSSRMSFIASFANETYRAVELRKCLKVTVPLDGELVDVTPKMVAIDVKSDKLPILRGRIELITSANRETFTDSRSIGTSSSHSFYRGTSTARVGGLRLSMDDIIHGVGSGIPKFDEIKSSTSMDEELHAISYTEHRLPFIRVVLKLTENFVLYEQRSLTALRETHVGQLVEDDNRLYDYLTIGKGKVRRRSEAEMQTTDVLCKTRDINTISTQTADKATYVSYFEMFDTYRALDQALATPRVDSELSPMDQLILPLPKTHLQQCIEIMRLPSFKCASMMIKRMLAGNVHEEQQRRFRNMTMPDRLSMDLSYRYTLRLLFQYPPHYTDNERKAVTDISFNSKNGDILAVSYGIYSFSAMHVPRKGIVCVWSIKNPTNPERRYYYNVPVVSVEFSPFVATLLAVGLYDGSVEVRDITYPNTPAIAVSQRTTSPGVDPVMAIKWVKQVTTDDVNEIEPFLTLSQDGSVTKFRIVSSPYLLGFKQMVLERVEGNPEGLLVKQTDELDQQANRQPQGLGLTIHPMYTDIYYVLTDEGCLHKCSTNYTLQYLDVWKTHEASVNCMDFSPWSPKLFLTCGNDWCIRIWMEGIFKPLLTLQSQMAPVHCALWSHTHSTVILALNRRTFDIWDIRRNLLKPVSSTQLESSYHTMFKISRCGRSVAIGNERGSVLMAALDNFPFPPHFQYDELEKALYKAISTFPDLMIELKSVGFFGYPHKNFVRPM